MAVFGELMAELRQDRGLTQKELGRILSVSTGTISNYENSVHYPDLEKLVTLADYFQVSTDYLLGRKTDTGSAHHTEAHDPQDETLVRMIRSLTRLPSHQRQALALIITDLEQCALAKHPSTDEGDEK